MDRGIQVFIFIEKSVHAEFETYRINKDNPSIKYKFVDNKKVYEFIDFVHGLPYNNPISSFELSADISDHLRAQWAGLFQRFLQDEKRQSEYKVLEEMRSVSSTLQELVKFLTDERKNSDGAVREILMANHPAFRRFAEVTRTPYRVYFTNLAELERWLKARQWEEVDPVSWNDAEMPEFRQKDGTYIAYKADIFNKDGSLKLFTDGEWSNTWVTLKMPVDPSPSESQPTRRPITTPSRRPPSAIADTEPDDEDIPF